MMLMQCVSEKLYNVTPRVLHILLDGEGAGSELVFLDERELY